MKLLFIYLVIVLVVVFYMWINVFKEGNQDLELKSIHELINGKKSDGTSNYSTDIDTNLLKSNNISSGITKIDRYSDPMCKPGEHIYCLDGQIECNDILGGKMNILQGMDPYVSGSTLAGCGSYVTKTNLYDYSKDIGLKMNSGVYFDLSNCKQPTPWRVGGIVIQNGYDKANTISPESYKCYPTESAADDAWNLLIDSSLNENAIYNANDDVFILASFLKTQTTSGLPQILSVIDNNKVGTQKAYTTINNQKYYYATIKSVTGTTYTVTIPNSVITVSSVPKTALLKNSLYNSKTNDYYSNLKTGSYPRPVCKSGAFTSCLSSPPFTMNNGKYISTKDPLLTVDSLYKASEIQKQNDFNQPFTAPPLNPSGIIDGPIESNYFGQNDPSTPFIKCIANYGSNIGDPLCCNQSGTIKDTKYICPEEVPVCNGYSKQDNTYGYCA